MGAVVLAISNQNILAISLLVVILLLIVQSWRLRRRDQEFAVTTEALLHQDQLAMLGRLMAGIAHELNTPLGAVCCSMNTREKAVAMIDEAVVELEKKDGDQSAPLAKTQKALRALHSTDPVLKEALTRTNQLIRELRLAGRGELDTPQPVDVNTVVDGTLLLLQHELKDRSEVKLELGQVQPVPGWPGPLGQVVLNLIRNASQAAGEGGTITISTAMADDRVVIKVSDDGPGLPAGCGDRIFKPGFTTKDSDEGTGLGLFITRKIMDRHQGEIRADNGPDGGAEFTVILPIKRSGDDPVVA